LRERTFQKAKVDTSLSKLINQELINQKYKELNKAANYLYGMYGDSGWMEHELDAEMTLRIYEAVYSNIMFPNISGEFYL
jgi:hypothetical protein